MFFFPRDFHKKAIILDKKICRLGKNSKRSARLKEQRKKLWEVADVLDIISYAMQDMPNEGIAVLFNEINRADYLRLLRRKIKLVKKLREKRLQ